MNDIVDDNGYVCCEIQKGMYVLKEARCIAFQNLVKSLVPFGYELISCTPGVWSHDARCTAFTLAVDDFGINNFNQDDLKYLLNVSKVYYSISINHTGSHYCDLQIDWNYTKKNMWIYQCRGI